MTYFEILKLIFPTNEICWGCYTKLLCLECQILVEFKIRTYLMLGYHPSPVMVSRNVVDLSS